MKDKDKSKFWADLKSGRFVSMVKESSKGKSLSNSREVYNALKPVFAREDDIEKACFIFLDAKNKILAIENLFSGTISASAIYPREVVKNILRHRASAIVMIHNHPSGDVTPSTEDKAITVKVGYAVVSIDVTLHDHIIVGNGYHSMADSGWLKKALNEISNNMNHLQT